MTSESDIYSINTHLIDARRLLCPMPVIKLQSLIKHCKHNDRIEITCCDPGTKHDIPTWCRLFKHQVRIISESEQEWLFEIIVNKVNQ